MTESNWWSTFYDENLALMLLQNTDAERDRETVDFLVDELAVQPGSLVFDQCCGEGRLSLPLARRGFRVFGLDQAAIYIDTAKRAKQTGATFVTGDAFADTPPELCDAGFNWWTSFGYAATDGQNVEMLRRAFESLKPGARFALDFLNVPNIIRDFSPSVVTRADSADGEVILLRGSELDLTAGLLLKSWTYFLPNGERVEHASKVRLYMPDQLRAFFEGVGFIDVTLYGSIDRSQVTHRSPRCVVVGRKP